jgi:hypothetical protein
VDRWNDDKAVELDLAMDRVYKDRYDNMDRENDDCKALHDMEWVLLERLDSLEGDSRDVESLHEDEMELESLVESMDLESRDVLKEC